jgi:Mce-associated membrane protein
MAVDADTAYTTVTEVSDPPAGIDGDSGPSADSPPPAEESMPRVRRTAVALIVVSVAAMAALAGWLGLRAYQSHAQAGQRAAFLQAGRQGALNLTTIDYTTVDVDVQRILNSATGTFYDDFQKRSAPFVQVVKQAQSKSKGSVTEAGIESMQADAAQVLVAVSVTTTLPGADQPQPRAWRMRVNVQKAGGELKISAVEFVP